MFLCHDLGDRIPGVLPAESFTAVVDSSEVGARKPDSAVFAVAAERTECRADQLLYFDDLAENIGGALRGRLGG